MRSFEDLALRRPDREGGETPEPAEPFNAPAPVPGEVDAAESRWDPWLLALAQMTEIEEARPN